MARLFGTDGVRGLANRDITAESALKLAQAAAIVLGEQSRSRGQKPIAVIGRDPRISGEFLAAAISAGLASSGVDVFDAGVIPTPATSFLTADLDADFGVMISASHNPAPDNGIKFFSRGGHKLADEVEDQIEQALSKSVLTPIGTEIGHVQEFADAKERYLVHLNSTLPNDLEGIKVVLDCANGAASDISPQAFKDAGAQVFVIGNDPDGHNINLGCGSTHLSALQAAVLEHKADVGIAHDGDADRTLAVDATGAIVDGDQIMAVLALAAKQRGDLARNTLVATVMSNLGLRIAMRQAEIDLIETKVGDRYVLEVIREGGYTLLLAQMKSTGKSLKELAAVMSVYPQVLINVPGVDKSKVDSDPELKKAVSEAEAELGENGRVLLRASGTEPLVRVMVEAKDAGSAQSWAERIARVVEKQLELSK
jgi:phosphoglucosamine mutase